MKRVRRGVTTFADKPCQICGGSFSPLSGLHVNCSQRCAYISRMLDRDAAKRMTRDDAIEYYGERFDVPFRSLGRSMYRPLVLAISEYCDAHNTTTFTYKQIAGVCDFEVCAQAIAGCANNVAAVRKTGNRVNIGNGKSVIEWEFNRNMLES